MQVTNRADTGSILKLLCTSSRGANPLLAVLLRKRTRVAPGPGREVINAWPRLKKRLQRGELGVARELLLEDVAELASGADYAVPGRQNGRSR